MERGLYIAASGMIAEMTRQDQIANELANSATPGYKPDRSAQRAFGSLLVTDRGSGQVVGQISQATHLALQVTDRRAHPMRPTGEPLDFAITGDGFFEVQTPQGLRFTRNGSFAAAADGTLVDQLGNRVLGPNGQAVRVPPDGTVDPRALGVSLVPDARKAGEGYFTGTATGRPPDPPRSGGLEASGVDPARTMVEMIASLRAFEAGQKVITTVDATLDRAASQVASLR